MNKEDLLKDLLAGKILKMLLQEEAASVMDLLDVDERQLRAGESLRPEVFEQLRKHYFCYAERLMLGESVEIDHIEFNVRDGELTHTHVSCRLPLTVEEKVTSIIEDVFYGSGVVINRKVYSGVARTARIKLYRALESGADNQVITSICESIGLSGQNLSYSCLGNGWWSVQRTESRTGKPVVSLFTLFLWFDVGAQDASVLERVVQKFCAELDAVRDLFVA
ncbi:hypothetical protein ACP3V3_19725 [Vibrio sp. PNB22_3_1]